MERKLASIQRIAEIQPIEGADAIEKARINGWWCVVKKGEFSVGELVVYCEVDSWIPYELAPFLSKGKEPREFEGVRGERLKTVKLRGQLSQGLILPLYPTCDNIISLLFEGLDVTSPLNIRKWDKPLPASLQGQVKRYFPPFIRKTDQERIQNLPEVFDDLDKEYEITLKLDGSSCTVYYNNGEVGVCSRNLELKLNDENAENTFIKTAMKTGLIDALKSLQYNIAVQAELMGPGIQGNRENLTDYQLFVFDIWDIDEQRYATPAERSVMFEENLKSVGFTGEHVPIITFDSLLDLGILCVDDALHFAERPSLNNPVAEGVVFKALDGSGSWKAISNKFLLGEE